MENGLSSPSPSGIAIIGLGCLFPRADHAGGFWANIKNGIDCITEIPPTHWKAEEYFDSDPKKPDMTYAKRGGFLSPIDFSPIEFGIAPNDLDATDTSQLLGLVVAQQALSDAGYGPEKKFDRSRVSIILGVTGTQELVIPLGARLGHPKWRKALQDSGIDPQKTEEVVQRIADSYVGWQENSFPGLLGNVVAGRIANRLDLGGTNCVVDAACASSLSAIHLAGLELEAGRSDIAVTGGVDTFNDIFMYMCFSKTPALSPTGNSKPFDRNGDGTILGEGLGIVVLKRLADAERDGDHIYAVIRSIGSSSDGKGAAIYAPVAEGQKKALKRAYELAGITPDTVELVEGHGTGTKVGDGVEVKALTDIYRESQAMGKWCALGSVKSQIGHTKAAAGAAGLIKAALALHYKVLPPTIKVNQPLEILDNEESPFYVNTEKRPWLSNESHPRRAAVSSFGFGGSNFHTVLEEYKPTKEEIDWDGDVEILALSGNSRDEIKQQLDSKNFSWSEIRTQAKQSRETFRTEAPCRLLIVLQKEQSDFAKQIQSAKSLLEQSSSERFRHTPDGIYYGEGKSPGKLGVLFPGQGSQYVGMLRDLACQFPGMQTYLSEANRIFSRLAGKETHQRLSDFIYPYSVFKSEERIKQEETLRQTQIAQPAIGAVSLGALKVLEHFGIEAQAFAGHSYGELPALYAAGVFDTQALHHLSRLRGHLMSLLRTGDPGSMLAVHASSDTISKVVQEESLDVVIANKNAPNQTVLSGSTTVIEKTIRILQNRQIRNTRLPVAAAFHSRFVADAQRPFGEVLASITFNKAQLPVFANTTAQKYPEDVDQMRQLLAGQLAKPVEFVQEIANMAHEGVRTFVEVGPGSTLTRLIDSILRESDIREWDAAALDSSHGKRSGILDLAQLLARLAARGHPVHLNQWQRGRDWENSQKKKAAMTIPISGANYTKPTAKESPKKTTEPKISNLPKPIAQIKPPAVKQLPKPKSISMNDQPMPSKIPTPQPVDSGALVQALQVTQQSLAAFQKMQEQTAQLHKQFLEQQESAQRTLQVLVEQQGILLQSSLSVLSTSPIPLPRSQPIPQVVAQRIETPIPQPVVQPTPTPLPKAIPPAPNRWVPPPPVEQKVEPPQTKSKVSVENILLSVVAEKTGYPAEMLNLDMAMDSDLGIDSIKRVEILSSLQDRLPDAPVVKPEHLGTLHTLRDVTQFLQPNNAHESNGVVIPVLKQPSSNGSVDIDSVLLTTVSDKTGYPVEMLNLDMAMDVDLGIDSIKRVEILSSLQERLPDAPVVKPEHLGTLHSLRDVSRFLQGKAEVAGSTQVQEPATHNNEELPNSQVTDTQVQRLVVRPVSIHGIERPKIDLPKGSKIWLIGDYPTLAKDLESSGYRLQSIAWNESPTKYDPTGLSGIILVAPETVPDEFPLVAFRWIRHAGRSLRQSKGILTSISRIDGMFGFGNLELQQNPGVGGLSGIVKTASREWPEISCKALDIDSSSEDISAIVDEVLTEGPVEVGMTRRGLWTLDLAEIEPIPSPFHLFTSEDVIVVTGGARGVTFETVLALAKKSPSRFVLLGRTEPPEAEPIWLQAAMDENSIKQVIIRNNKGLSPKEVNSFLRRIVAQREITQNLNRLSQTGATGIYLSVDVQDRDSIVLALSRIRQQFGGIHGLIYGAGVLADRKIEDLTDEQFQYVYDTKVNGLRNFLEATTDDPIKGMVFFSSSTGRFGRIGQVAYAAANEVLNKLAQEQSRIRPNCKVVAINWGPWEGGMVTPALKELFASEGVACIPLQAGGEFLVRELTSSDRVVEVVALAKSESNLATSTKTVFERTISLSDHPVLSSHILDHRAVLPMALHIEWLAHAALHGNPGLQFHGYDNLRITRGVQVEEQSPVTIQVLATTPTKRDAFLIVPVEMRSQNSGREVIHSRAEIILTSKLSHAPDSISLTNLQSYPYSVEEIYQQFLFHGSELQGIQRIEAISENGLVSWSRTSPSPKDWMSDPLRDQWITDPMVLDVSFQLMILWTFHQQQKASLPCFAGRYRQYVRAFPSGEVRIVCHVKKVSGSLVRADIDFSDSQGQLLARLEDYECVMDQTLEKTFRHNQLSAAFVR